MNSRTNSQHLNMPHIYKFCYFFGCILLLGFWGCGTTSESDQSTSEDYALDENVDYSREIQFWETILGDYQDAMFRGISLGDTREKVQITETFDLFEEMPWQIGYTHDTQDLETVDVFYLFSEDNRVSEIKVDIYLNGDESTDRMWAVVGRHFNINWGEPLESSDDLQIWENHSVRVEVENVSGKIDNGLKIRFSTPFSTRLTHN